MRRLVLALLPALAVACQPVTANDVDPAVSRGDRVALADVEAAEARWRALGVTSYAFEQRSECLCGEAGAEWVRVSVAEGAVVAVEALADGRALDPAGWRTLEQVFAGLKSAAADPAVPELEAAFDAASGVPTRILLGASDRADGRRLDEIRNLVCM